jgi:hypothetical protein
VENTGRISYTGLILAGGRVVPLEVQKAVQALEAVDRALQSKAP